MVRVHSVISNHGREQSNVRKCQLDTDQKIPTLESGLNLLHGRPMLSKSKIVSLLCCSKTAPVDTIVDAVVHEITHLVNLRSEVLGVQIHIGVLSNTVECTVQHGNDAGTFVVDDLLSFLIEQNRNRVHWSIDTKRSSIPWFGKFVQLIQELEIMGVLVNTVIKLPSAICSESLWARNAGQIWQSPGQQGHRNSLFQTLQGTDNECTMRPRTSSRHIQPVSAGLGHELGPSFNKRIETTCSPLERPFLWFALSGRNWQRQAPLILNKL
mmetsp:Transcript_5129/g.12032  ORF Transcript_5129/g.12032 Transcript_5129/m.12032 type:complete len:268 (+) Transcript_5129:362-1165(+)